MELKFSQQTLDVLNQIKDFNKEDFTNWWMNHKFVVGSTHIIEYLLWRKNKDGNKK